VVDDGSTDGAAKYAEEFGAKVLHVGSRRGPANGRNIGAMTATGDIILFLDADVCVHQDTIPRIRQRLEEDPDLGAVFGSYDSEPDAPGLVSQFRNLLHCFVHQTSSRRASTFWAGCGAMRRQVFLDNQGFDISYSVPCIEDIELGTRLVNKGVKIALDPAIQVKHLKRWTLPGMVITDICQRGIPWTQHILASHKIPNDLNLRLGSRASVFLTGALGIWSALFGLKVCLWGPGQWSVRPATFLAMVLALIVAVNLPFYRFLTRRRSSRFAAACVPLHLVYFASCATAFALGVAIYASTQMVQKFSRRTLAAADHFDDSQP
jgi:hypothetical protein